ncbi:hypothetical protein CFK37_07325 [Virgibacillus phasianinus]|uniref:DUF1002 domain-containing protein n=1 Tax=Virgibacillus phasianinus TaxID=2017483 RepID=A0A220U8F3_9BACI|nr:DUF1002 domain-containing protein [Virgibacillus phasianinus]ASK64315.1 hypothetical protein CFK37_07325 [Virgibacillus phasianinus]
MKKFITTTVMMLLIITFTIGITQPTFASTSINEKLGVPILVLGANLSDAQKDEVRKILNVKDDDTVEEYTITGEDAAIYINGNPDARMFSSAKITRQEEGKGLTINIETPDNITEVTSEMYANALLTAGVENATVDVASPVKVSGHSALTGIYKAYDVQGADLDKERMELANEELGVATDLAKKDGLSQEKVSELLTEIKKDIAEQNPATKEEVEKIIEDRLSKLNISLSDADRQMLVDLFNKMRDLNIDFDKVKNQLEDLTTTIKDKADELGLDEGFWTKVANFFSEFFQALSNFFKGLFN